ncbi:MAG TPA: ATP phosphoribosyltransferase [Caulobacteraceae bacterium]|nr:ATP phosphoribosyltransferase [Caulobacteraceae bacterium]
MSAPLIFAVPSKGRLKDQVEAWLADCGVSLRPAGGARGYQAALEGFAGLEVRLASAADIAAGLAAGEIHLGVTGEDLLREVEGAGRLLLMALGFGRADLVVAAPRSWIDVATMADVDDLAHDILARTGRRLRVATKYPAQTRAFFAQRGVADYRIVESTGATEGAPAAGLAELIVDITTTGATLAANGLKVLADGLILSSQARLAAGLGALWSAEALALARRLLAVFEARARGHDVASLIWPAAQDRAARAAAAAFAQAGEARANGALIARADLFAAMEALARADVGPVSVTQPAYVFEPRGEAADRLVAAVGAQSGH